MFCIAFKLSYELAGTRELYGIAQARNELHGHGSTVPIPLRLEQMQLEGHGRVAEGWAGTQVHHAAERGRPTLDPNGINPMRREQLPMRRELEVECWEPEQPSAAFTGHHPASE